MLKHLTRIVFVAALWISSFALLATHPVTAAPRFIVSVETTVVGNQLIMTVTSNQNVLWLEHYSINNGPYGEYGLSDFTIEFNEVTGLNVWTFTRGLSTLPCGSTGSVMWSDLGIGEGGNEVTASFSPRPCTTLYLGNIRGTAFEDKNGNGKWDNGEPTFGGAWYKVTDGGNWYVCGTTGDDSTFGVPVKSGIYYVLPINLQGYRVTTPKVPVVVSDGQATLNANIGYIKDPNAKLEGCDTYNPPRP